MKMPIETPAYDDGNVFAKILRGEMPSEKVYEDEHTLAFMDIMPRGDGHCLVLPKAPARNILDVKPEDLAHVAATTQKIARAVLEAFDADGVTVQQFNEPAGGQVVFHLHVHVIPRFEGVALRPHTGDMADSAELKANAERIRGALGA
jgi:histidine triad (HIT) family protein